MAKSRLPNLSAFRCLALRRIVAYDPLYLGLCGSRDLHHPLDCGLAFLSGHPSPVAEISRLRFVKPYLVAKIGRLLSALHRVVLFCVLLLDKRKGVQTRCRCNDALKRRSARPFPVFHPQVGR